MRITPHQKRSLHTQERLLDAMKALLEERDADDINVEDIVERAGLSVGAFYKRFSSKADLLPLLYSRLQTMGRQALQAQLADSKWNGRGLAERVDALVDIVAEAHRYHFRVIRACVSAHHNASLVLNPAELAAAREHMMRIMGDWLLACRDEIRHENPALAVRCGLYMCLQTLQSSLLFEPLTLSADREALVNEAKRMLVRYLTT
jgi:AcrR family transcriptional regulator